MSGYRILGKPQMKYKGRMDHPDEAWLIWSNKNGCWYRANSAGYTNFISAAGIYTKAEAMEHYDGPQVARKYRDTEPFPVSAVRKHIDIYERDIDRQYLEKKNNIAAMREAMKGRST